MSSVAVPADNRTVSNWTFLKEGEESDPACELLANHGIPVTMSLVGEGASKRMTSALFVRGTDHARAMELLRQLEHAFEHPPTGWWRCASCGEQHEATFDVCWQCGTDR